MKMTEKSDWLDLLQESKIKEFNQWRMSNILVKIDLSGMDFSGKDLFRLSVTTFLR